ncbi:hypothetical protein [Tsukamurella pseudospumae]|uniref:DUF4365 domain-containing protein n=1 Tax=Tsukamurella pseudospumae TaxID=239498 RepID=A0A138AEC7_9ACTN|nr:hypothetical protein [Tsukamurella pseudospumae]KXP08826.1 hypothetical protein AXK60_09190 [Tsukamurella pseudospumae]
MDKKLVKSVGEHWVCSELARRGWATALTRDGLARTDILAVNTELPDRPMIELQVKTVTQQRPGQSVRWLVGKTVGQNDASDREWFVLVVVPPGDSPLKGYVIPRDHLTAATHLQHTDWLKTPNPKRERRAGMDQARLHDTKIENYSGRWDLLERPTSESPDLLPAELTALIDDPRVGLPDGHPWLDGKRPAAG